MKSTWSDFKQADDTIFHPFRKIFYAGTENEYQTLYLSIPKKEGKKPLVIFFHGGGMTGGGRECPGDLFNGEYVIAEPRYRLSPAVHAPAHMEDAASAVQWCFAHAEELNIDKKKIFVGGMSAGAYLAAITVMDQKYLAPYGLSYRDLAGLLLISGQMTTHFRIKADLGRDNGIYNPLVDEYAPLSYLSADLPPILLVTGESSLDMPARPEENAFVAASLRSMGHPFVRYYALNGHDHGGAFHSCDFVILRFIQEVLAKSEKTPL